MIVKTKPFKLIDREYIISDEELKKELGLEGEIIEITNHKKGCWCIKTTEKQETINESIKHTG